MTSTSTYEWLQPLVALKVAELNSEASKDLIAAGRSAYETLQKNNQDLKDKLEKAKEALRFYAEQKHYLDDCRDYSEYDNADWIEGNVENGQKAREALAELEA